MFFDTPLKFQQRRWQSLCKVLICPVCKIEFKQNIPAQFHCSPECQNENRPWVPGVLRVFDEFKQFIAQHGIVIRHIIQPEMWHRCLGEGNDRHHGNTEFRKKIAIELDRAMDRFRRGYIIETPAGAKFINPPWQKLCPIEHTYCLGTILPRSCPRRHPECVYTKGDWQAIFKLRRLYEFTLDKMRLRGPVRRIYEPVIRYGHKHDPKSHVAAIHERPAGSENPRF